MATVAPSGVPPDLVEMARVKEPYGLKGWVKLYSYSEGAGLVGSRQWWLDHGSEAKPDWRIVEPDEVGEHSGVLIVKFPGVDDRDAAFALKGKRIALPRSSFPKSKTEDDEYYWTDLIGLEVKNRQDELLGVIDGLLDLGPHEVLQVKAPAVGDAKPQEILIPFVAQYIDAVELGNRLVKVDWEKDY
ncbi:MAG TPA: ribosome maturation factor RimM [Burkholderiales bacterium]